MRVAVIGARCRNQGIGAHLARFFVQAGADVSALLGTTHETAADAAETLFQTTGHFAAAYIELETLLREHEPEVLVIASPHETHETYLRRALEAGTHVLCEKPLVWGGDDAQRDAEELARAFLAAGLHLRVNTQWPQTLGTYRELFPDAPLSPRRFSMRMSPRSEGRRMIPAAVPHVLSLLDAVLPAADARIEHVRIKTSNERIDLAFRYEAPDGTLETEVELVRCPEPPRPAAYGFDGLIAHRHVDLDGYEMSLRDGNRRIPLPDPTPMLVRSFLDRMAAGPPTAVDPAAIPGMRLLMQIETAARNQTSPTP